MPSWAAWGETSLRSTVWDLKKSQIYSEVSQQVFIFFTQMGNECRRLERLCDERLTKDRGQTYLGLISGLKKYLRLYRTTIHQVRTLVFHFSKRLCSLRHNHDVR